MKVLVAGASGYLGHWVTRLLAERGTDVVALSRRGSSEYGRGLVGDVTVNNLGVRPEVRDEILSDVDVIVSCFGSVDWDHSPNDLVNLHVSGTRNVLDLAAALPSVERVVHVSSILALGRAEGVVGNRELAVDQSFRNWYEYAKYRAESLARRERRTEVSIVRFGPLLGPAPEHLVPLTGGPLQALPHLLQGVPLMVERGGRYPVFAGDVAVAADVVASLVHADSPPAVCTYFDPAQPTLARILHELCQPWGCVPRLVDGKRGRWLQRLVAERIGMPASTLEYASPMVQLDPAILDALPRPVAAERPDYIVDTGEILRRSRRPLMALEATL